MNFLQDLTCEELEEDECNGGTSLSPTLGSLLERLCYTVHKKINTSQLPHNLADCLHIDFRYFFKKKIVLAICAQNYSGIRFVVKQRTKNNNISLLFDGRHLRRYTNEEFRRPLIFHLLLDENYNVLKETFNMKGIPTNHLLPKNISDLPLHELLGLRSDFLQENKFLMEDPQDYVSTIAWLDAANVKVSVIIFFCFRLLPNYTRTQWIERRINGVLTPDVLILDAFTGKDNKLKFRHKKANNLGRPKVERKEHNADCTDESEDKDDPLTKNNRSSGVTVTLNGITQAVYLGLLDLKDAAHMSRELSKAVGALWLHVDSNKKVRYIGYRDGLGFSKCFEICPHLAVFDAEDNEDPHFLLNNDDDDHSNSSMKFEIMESRALTDWNVFFDIVFQRREVLLKRKAEILGHLIEKYNNVGTQQCKSTISRCITSLKACLKKMKLIVLCRGDYFLHAIKLWFAKYISDKAQKGHKGLYLRSSGENEIGALISSCVDIDNIERFFAIEKRGSFVYEDEGEDIMSILKDWLPTSKLHEKILPFKPLIDDKVSVLNFQGQVYSPGHIVGYEKGYRTCLRKRSLILTACVLELYVEFTRFLFETFQYDFASLVEYQSVPSLAFKCIWLSFYKHGGPLSHSIEKTKPAYEEVLRSFCHGGFSYSCESRVNSGDALCTVTDTGEKAKAIAEYDVTSCYGYCMSTLRVPGAFCVGYSEKNDDIVRTDRIQRTNTFEYKSCMLLLKKMVDANYNITSVYSNFSPLGLFYVKKYPADLVVVTVNKGTIIFQFDGRFIHGCAKCKQKGTSLKRYCNDKDEAELIEKSANRDTFFQIWIDIENAREGGPRYSYNVISDCHTPHFTEKELLHFFKSEPELKKLREPYTSLPLHLLNYSNIVNAHPDLTYLLVGSGKVPENLRCETHTRNGTLLVWKKDRNGKMYQDFGWETPDGGSLFTRDTLEYAIKEHNFELESISSCYFFRRCNVMPKVFDDLIRQRQLCGSKQKSKAKLIKSIVNFGTGMLGYNPHNKKRTSLPRIVKRLKYNPNSNIHIFAVGQIKQDMFSVVQSVMKKATTEQAKKKPCNVALPLYISVVEYGKQRLLECLTFLFAHARPGAIKLCYSQIDCAVVALAGNTLEEAIAPSNMDTFESEKKHFFTTDGTPGHLKEEWVVSTADFPNGWKFASPYICCYALVPAADGDNDDLPPSLKKIKLDFDEGHSKASSFNCLTTQTTYQLACNAIDNVSMIIEQQRRTNKLLSTATKIVPTSVPFLKLNK